METIKDPDVIDIRQLIKKVLEQKMLFVKVLPTVFVLSCLFIICIPRTYTTSCRLAPEINTSGAGGVLGSLASSFGIDFSQMETSDAITPMLYPDLMEDNKFVVDLFSITVENVDGSLRTSYADYLRKHQKQAWWSAVTNWFARLLKSKEEESLTPRPSLKGEGSIEPSPYILSKLDHNLCEAIRGKIELGIDKKTGVISVTVSDQDPLICKTVADSVSLHLQKFITEYRTSKARVDEEYFRNLVTKAAAEYDEACEAYAEMSDANSGLVLNRYQLKLANLEKRMDMKYAALQSLTGQLQAASAKVQDRTPVFTVLKGAEMPIRASKPKRMVFVAGMVFVAFIGTILYILKKNL